MTPFAAAAAKLEFETVRARVLRYASSEPGRETLRAMEIRSSRDEIRTELDRVTAMKHLHEHEEGVQLETIYPIRTFLQKAAIEGSCLQGKELAHIVSTLRTSRLTRSFFSRRKEDYPLLWEIAERLYADKVLEYNIDTAVDETGAVKASASRELQAIRRGIAERYDQLRKRLAGILRGVTELGFTQDEIITTREGRMVIPVKAEHKNRVPGFIHSASLSGATVFIEPTETLELNNEITGLQFQEQREVERILKGLTIQVGGAKAEMIAMLEALAALDALQAKAKYSLEILGTAPRVERGGMLRIVEGRHPLLLISHGRDGTVPLTIELDEDCTTLVISGPNAGGKSVAMKCVGLLVLMVQSGLHVPVGDGSVFRLFRDVFVDIGDEQSIESDLSTFSSHLRNLQQIVSAADRETLVLIDEIGAGTDPAEGGAIASAVLEWLTSHGVMTIATTHHGGLKVFAHETTGIENGAMEFDQSNLTPTYRFRAGVPGSSYALEMAERLGFQADLMKRSRALLGEGQHKLESLLTELEASLQRTRNAEERLHAEQTRLQDLTRTYEERVGALAREAKDLRRKAAEEAREIVDRANAVIEQSVRSIRESGAEKATVREAHNEIEKVKERVEQELGAVRSEEPAESSPPRVGDAVTIKGAGDVGHIQTIIAEGRTAVVAFGNVKLKVPFHELRRAKVIERTRDQISEIREAKRTTATRELDLRGLTGDEALPMVDKFLDDALLAGYETVSIVHGKGTGALRKKVVEFLEHHPRVSAFRYAEWNEGGTGATVVELSEGK